MKLSVIMPVFNEENTVVSMVEKVKDALLNIQKEIIESEIVIVEDGSKDNTRQKLEEAFGKDEKIKLFFQGVNQGKGAAITRGFKESTGDIVLVQDADEEYDPYEFPILLSPFFNKNADVVYGSRFRGGEVSRVLYFWHSVGNQFLTLLSNMFANLNLTDMETCYKVFKGDLIRNMILESKRFGIEPEMTAKIAKLKEVRIYEVPISYNGRTYAQGKKIGWKDGFSALWCIVKYNLLTTHEESFKK